MPKAKDIPYTQEELKELFDYNPETGELVWKSRGVEMFPDERACKSWNTKYAGKRAGRDSPRNLRRNGYSPRCLRLLGSGYLEHRIIWMWWYGEQPPEEIDHKNRDARDNRIDNLREGHDNHKNLSLAVNNKSGVSGVSWCKKMNKWRVRGKLDGVEHILGYFEYEDLDLAAMEIMEWRAERGFDPKHGLEFSPYLDRSGNAKNT